MYNVHVYHPMSVYLFYMYKVLYTFGKIYILHANPMKSD